MLIRDLIKFKIELFILIKVFIGIPGAPQYKIPPNNKNRKNRSTCLPFGGGAVF